MKFRRDTRELLKNFVDVRTFWLGESIAQPGDLGKSVGFLLDRIVGSLEFLPIGSARDDGLARLPASGR